MKSWVALAIAYFLCLFSHCKKPALNQLISSKFQCTKKANTLKDISTYLVLSTWCLGFYYIWKEFTYFMIVFGKEIFTRNVNWHLFLITNVSFHRKRWPINYSCQNFSVENSYCWQITRNLQRWSVIFFRETHWSG